jgi:hypothetical protein
LRSWISSHHGQAQDLALPTPPTGKSPRRITDASLREGIARGGFAFIRRCLSGGRLSVVSRDLVALVVSRTPSGLPTLSSA